MPKKVSSRPSNHEERLDDKQSDILRPASAQEAREEREKEEKNVFHPLEQTSSTGHEEVHSPDPVTAIPAGSIQKDKELLDIEAILEDGLGDIYAQMSQDQKKEFKHKGEETARKIFVMIHTVKIHVRRIFAWILEWLKFLPGVNIFFIKQTAKIKTDELIKYAAHAKKDLFDKDE